MSTSTLNEEFNKFEKTSISSAIANEMSSALKQAYGASQKKIASVMKSVGYSPDQIAGALVYTFSATDKETAQILNDHGYGADETTKALEYAFGEESLHTVNTVLKAVGYSTGDIKSAFDDIGGDLGKYSSKARKT